MKHTTTTTDNISNEYMQVMALSRYNLIWQTNGETKYRYSVAQNNLFWILDDHHIYKTGYKIECVHARMGILLSDIAIGLCGGASLKNNIRKLEYYLKRYGVSAYRLSNICKFFMTFDDDKGKQLFVKLSKYINK